jgi:hypothetical protein
LQKMPKGERPGVGKGLKELPVPLAGNQTVQQRALQLERDLTIIQALVDGGLKLATENDPLLRADCCNRIADILASAINKAVQIQDAERAAHLGEQMESLLVVGVATNLGLAREQMEPDSPREPEIQRISGTAVGVAKTIEAEIGRLPAMDARMRQTLQSVAKGRTKVESAALAKSKNGKSKKGKLTPR